MSALATAQDLRGWSTQIKTGPASGWPTAAPPIARAINSLGKVFLSPGRLARALDEQRLKASAVEKTGLTDFGDPSEYQEGLSRVLWSLEHEAHLTLLGLGMALDSLLQGLVSRLYLVQARKERPSLPTEPIRRPIIVIGMPRTGTTALQRLLAADPAALSMPMWALMRPFPLATAQQWKDGSSPLRQEQLRVARWTTLLRRDFDVRHEMGPDLPDEEFILFHPAFHSLDFGVQWPVPTYAQWLYTHDATHAYACLRQTLRLIEERREGSHWVLKSPAHSLTPELLLETFPDAGVVHIHRDPARSVPSCMSLFASTYAFGTHKADPDELAVLILEMLLMGSQRTALWRQQARPANVMDLTYDESTRDPIGAVRRIYDRFNLPWGEETLRAMNAHRAEHTQHRKGVHRYAAADFGLDEGKLREIFGQWERW